MLSAFDITDVAIVVGLVLLWIGLGMVAPSLSFIVVGTLAIAYGLAPTVIRSRR
jgi:hypothetical protein